MTPAYSPRFDDAVALAVASFRHKFRKSTPIPYVTHLFAVCAKVGEHGGDEDQLIAAVLHDYLEDVRDAEAADLEARFGPRVASLVVRLSDSVSHPKPPWRQRKVAYLAHLGAETEDLKLISAADKWHNASSIVRDLRTQGDALFERFRGKKDGTLWYYREVAVALGQGWEHPLLEELRHEVARIHDLAG